MYTKFKIHLYIFIVLLQTLHALFKDRKTVKKANKIYIVNGY